MSQWVNVPEGASGSSRIRTKLLVPDGTFTQETPGVRDDPVQVNSWGSVAPGVTESTVRVKSLEAVDTCVGMDVVTAEVGESGEGVPGAVQPQVSTRKTTRQEQRIRMIFINGMSPAERIYLMTPRCRFYCWRNAMISLISGTL